MKISQLSENARDLKNFVQKCSFYVTRSFSKSCKIVMFFAVGASRWRHSDFKTKASISRDEFGCDNEKSLKEFLLQKYLFDHYMIWKIDCFSFSSLHPGPRLVRLFLKVSSRFSRGVYWSFSNKNQTASINNFFCRFKVIFVQQSSI